MMENTETTSAPQPKWFHNEWFSRGTLVIAALFFLLPFININCSGNKLASIRGIDMIIGTELKPAPSKEEEKVVKEDPAKAAIDSLSMGIKAAADSLSKEFNFSSDSLTKGLNSLTDSLSKSFAEQSPFPLPTDMLGGQEKKVEPNAGVITAFACVLLALVFSFFKNRVLAITAGALSLLAAAALFILQLQIASEIQKTMGPFSFVPITVEFTNFYWLCLLFLITASVFSFIRSSFKAA